jgi:hypothetical protein
VTAVTISPSREAHISFAAIFAVHSSKDISMSKLTRREIAALAAGGTLAAALVGVSATPAAARQGNMDHALRALREARRALQDAVPNKGGHRERAIDLVDRAIDQVREGIAFANRRG